MPPTDHDTGATGPQTPRVDLFAQRPLPPPKPVPHRRRGGFGRLVLLAGTATILGVGAWVVFGGIHATRRIC